MPNKRNKSKSIRDAVISLENEIDKMNSKLSDLSKIIHIAGWNKAHHFYT